MGTAAPKETAPVAHSACRIPTEAEELWITAVSAAPLNIPRTGLENMVRIPVNSGTSASGFTAPLMVSIPVIRMAKPTRIVPRSFCFSLRANIRRQTPASARAGEKEDGFSRRRKKLLLSIPDRLKIHEVMVVPMFAPMIIPTACVSFIMMPELTNPTTITVVAEDD